MFLIAIPNYLIKFLSVTIPLIAQDFVLLFLFLLIITSATEVMFSPLFVSPFSTIVQKLISMNLDGRMGHGRKNQFNSRISLDFTLFPNFSWNKSWILIETNQKTFVEQRSVFSESFGAAWLNLTVGPWRRCELWSHSSYCLFMTLLLVSAWIVLHLCENLTSRCSLLVQEPMTLYSAIDLLLIWYWKMSYLPGASPFSLKTTGIPALPGNSRRWRDDQLGIFQYDSITRWIVFKWLYCYWSQLLQE